MVTDAPRPQLNSAQSSKSTTTASTASSLVPPAAVWVLFKVSPVWGYKPV